METGIVKLQDKGARMEQSALRIPVKERPSSRAFAAIKTELLSTPLALCPERALIITDFYKHFDDPTDPMVIRKAKALRHLMSRKTVRIFSHELITGNVGRSRKSAIIQPELSGVFTSQDLLWIGKRKTTPMKISWADRLRLLFRVIPFWLFRNMLVKGFMPHIGVFARYTMEQLNATWYLINEVAGIGHFIPNYEKIISIGLRGYRESLAGKEGDFYRAMEIVCEGVETHSRRLADEAERAAGEEEDEDRAAELHEIARICRKVPMEPAETFHEAVQSLWLAHLAVCLEGINSAVSFGRMDQYLYPYYRRDLSNGTITPERARELLLCFCAKTTEHVFQISETSSQYHGGFLIVQAVTIGGTDRNGDDAVNDLTYLFLDVMEESGLRDPNFHARIHPGSPERYVRRAVDVARQGKGVPALFNDDAAVAALTRHGHPVEEARDYAIVGCVEPSMPGRSFFSTDAALFNLPACLDLALNGGRPLAGGKRIGAPTGDPGRFASMDEVMSAFSTQVVHMVHRFVKDIMIIERANRKYHPTPFSSMLVDGCIESGRDVTAGGARYTSSGIQGVGVADTADSLAALDHVVFRKKKYSMGQVIRALRNGFDGFPEIRAELLKAPKFGNDHPLPDGYAQDVVGIFHDALAAHRNTRGGPYVPGFYSSTCHVGFGNKTGALPSGRMAGTPFAASLGSANGMDRLGPTALLNSVSRIDASLSPNGYAVNLRFDPEFVAGERGATLVASLARGFFAQGGMELQFNVVSPELLEDARAHPGRHPGLVVRVAGYLAYFDDLPDSVKGEIIGRTRLRL